jgi:hypothetical protein
MRFIIPDDRKRRADDALRGMLKNRLVPAIRP